MDRPGDRLAAHRGEPVTEYQDPSKWWCEWCRKTAYESESRGWGAIHAIHTMPPEKRTPVVPVRVYECPHRNGWHLTHQRGRFTT